MSTNETAVDTSTSSSSINTQNNDSASSSYANVVLNLKTSTPPREDKSDSNKENIEKSVNNINENMKSTELIKETATSTSTAAAAGSSSSDNVAQQTIKSTVNSSLPNTTTKTTSASTATAAGDTSSHNVAKQTTKSTENSASAYTTTTTTTDEQHQHDTDDDKSFIPVVSHHRKERKITTRRERPIRSGGGAGNSERSGPPRPPRRRLDTSAEYREKRENRRSKDKEAKLPEANADGSAVVETSANTSPKTDEEIAAAAGSAGEAVKFVEAPIPAVNAWKVIVFKYFLFSLKLIILFH